MSTIRAAMTEATTDLYVHDGDDNYRPLDLDVDAILAHPAMRPLAELLEGRTVKEVAEKVALAERAERDLTVFGTHVVTRRADGSTERLDPTRVRIAIEEALR